MFAFLYAKANSKKICEEISFPFFFFRKKLMQEPMADVSIFVEVQG